MEFPEEMKVGKIDFKQGDTMLVQYSRVKTSGGMLAEAWKNLPKSFPGVRIVFIPDELEISRLRFETVDGKVLEPISISADVLKFRERVWHSI